MAVTKNSYTAASGSEQGPYSYSFPVVDTGDIKVSVNGIVKTVTTHYTLDTNNTRITFVSGQYPTAGDNIIVYRETDDDPITTTFVSGSTIRASELNDNFNQILYLAQEADDQSLSSLGGTMSGTLHLDKDQVITFEGSTDDGNDTTLTVENPTANRTLTLPNKTGALVSTGDTGTVTSAMIANGTIETGDIKADQITSALIADDQINSEHYVDGSIDLAHMSANSVGENQYVDDSIKAAHIADDQITIDHLNITNLETLNGMRSATATALAAATDLSASITNLNITTGMTKATSLTPNSDTEFPTSKAVNDQISTVVNAVGGFVAIADEDNFPTSHPDPSDGAGTIISISDAGGLSINSSGVATNARSAGNGSDNVTINGFPSALRGGVGSNADPNVLAADVGLQVQTTTTEHTYTYHKVIIKEATAVQLSNDITDFNSRYRIAASAPGSSLDEGDLYFNTTDNKLQVYATTDSGNAWQNIAVPGDFYINTISSSSGTGGGSATLNGSAYRFTLSNAGTFAAQHIVSIAGVIQKPNTGTSQPSEGFAIDGNDIIFSTAPANGAAYFIVTIGNSVNLGTPANNSVSTAKIVADAVNGDKIADDSIGAEHIEVLDAALEFANDVQLRLGADSDIKIYHENSSGINWIEGTGDLKIQRADGDIYLNPKAGETAVKCITDGAVELYEDGNKKFETTATGIKVTGTIKETGFETDVWRIHSPLDTSDSTITTNLERIGNGNGDASFTKPGTGMTLLTGSDAGIFTFPSTGYWEVTFNSTAYTTNSRHTVQISIWASTDGGSNAYEMARSVQSAYAGIAGSPVMHWANNVKTIIKVAHTTNTRVHFRCTSATGNASFHGSSDLLLTYMTFTRLGDL